MTPPQTPAGTLAIHRELHDDVEYTVIAAAPGVMTLSVRDADGDRSVPSFDRAAARQLVDDIELAAGLKPTAAMVDLETALVGSMRILFQRLDDDLEKADPVAANRIRAAMIAHLRSKQPALLGGGAL